MVRLVLCFVGLAACQPAPATTPAQVPAAIQLPAPASAEPESPEDPLAAEPTPRVAAALRVEEGWVRTPDDPNAPLIQLQRVDGHGASGAAALETIVGAASGILRCWEVAVAAGAKRGSVGIHVRRPTEPDGDPLRVDFGQDADPEAQRCIDAAVRKRLTMPEQGDSASVGFMFFSRRENVVMATLDPGGEVAVRAGSSCWQWKEEGPCPAHKRCYASRWIRTSCGAPAMRDDVSVRFGLGTPKGERAPLSDARLVGGDGTVLWVTPLASDFLVGYGEYRVSKEGSIAATTSAYAVEFARETVTVADAVGLQIYKRIGGKRLLSWAAPERGESTLWFDDGRYVIRRGKTVCEGDAGRGGWYAKCGDRRVYFDGYSLAVFGASTAKLIATRHLGQGKNRLTGRGTSPSAELSTGGVQVEIRGNVFMH